MKPWYSSKTLWVNIITLLISVVAIIVDSPMFPARIIAVLTSIVLPVLNMVLRLLTTQTIESVITKNPA
jgi:hypothetical protein